VNVRVDLGVVEFDLIDMRHIAQGRVSLARPPFRLVDSCSGPHGQRVVSTHRIDCAGPQSLAVT
jgi:hypothetical protein